MAADASNPPADVRAAAHRHFTEGEKLYAAANYAAALTQYQHALRLWEHPGFHFKLAMAFWRLGDLAATTRHLLETVRLQPDSLGAHEALTHRLMNDGQIAQALEHSRIALSLAPAKESVVIARASVLYEAGREKEAWEIIGPLLAGRDTPEWAAILYGKIAGAVHQENEALALILTRLERAPAGPETASLHFRAAALLDKAGRYDEAFQQARLAHEANGRPYDADRDERLADGLIQFFTKPVLRSLPKATHGSRRPVFIVGMPRSGTSLVEQILSSHPAVYGAGELSTLQDLACGLNNAPWAGGKPFPACLQFFSVREANELAGRYLAELSRLNTTATYVTDKLPLNSRDLWLVQLLFPEARVIHCVRDARDTCLSCYMTDFASGNEYAQDLETLGRFHRGYERLMNHWNSVLDLPILQVPYELMVQDVEAQARRMLDFLNLPWDDRCLRFYENRRHVATASQSQVRRPVYKSSVGRWRHYEKHLGPLVEAFAQGENARGATDAS